MSGSIHFSTALGQIIAEDFGPGGGRKISVAQFSRSLSVLLT